MELKLWCKLPQWSDSARILPGRSSCNLCPPYTSTILEGTNIRSSSVCDLYRKKIAENHGYMGVESCWGVFLHGGRIRQSIFRSFLLFCSHIICSTHGENRILDRMLMELNLICKFVLCCKDKFLCFLK